MSRTKRATGEGSVPRWNETRGYWQANYTAADGTRKSVYSSIPGPKGAAECRSKMAGALEVTRAGNLPASTRLTVATWMEEWISVWKTDCKPRTIYNYQANLRTHITPAIGHKPLNGPDRLTATDVKAMLSKMAAKGRSETTRQLVFDNLKAALAVAVEDGKATDNAAARVKRPGRDTVEFEPWTDAEVVTFLASVQGDRLEAVWYINLLLGTRLGEVIGIRWSDVDFETGTVTIAGQLDRFTHRFEGRKGRNAKPVSHVMPDVVVDLLRERQTAQKREQIRAGHHWTGNPQGLVFTTRYGTPIPHNNLGPMWHRAISRVPGLRQIKLHGARHYTATMLNAAGYDDATVAAALGQRDKGITARKVYVHLRREAVSGAAREAAAALPLPARKVAL